MFIGAFVGVYWMLCASIFTGFIAFLLNSWFTGKFLNYSSWQQLKDVLPSYLIAIFVGFIVYLLKFIPLSFNLIFPLQILATIIVGWIVNQIVNLEEFREIKKIIQTVKKKYGKKFNH